jgi:hypothetical protein
VTCARAYRIISASFDCRNTSKVMSGFYLAFILTVIGMVLYHLSQKAVPKETNPFL